MKAMNLFLPLLLAVGVISNTAQAQALPNAPVQRGLDIQFESPKLAEQGPAITTVADFGAYLSRIPEADRPGFLNSRVRIGQAIENLMLPRLLAAEARSTGFVESPELQALLYQSSTVLIAEEFLEHYFSEQELDDYSQLAREIHLTQPERFRSPPTVSFTHVLVAPNAERGELGMMREIFRIYEEMNDGADLADLAREYSDDPSVVENGGSYVDTDPAVLDPEFARALSMMQEGRMSEPVRSQFGWHIIRLDGRGGNEPLSWEEAEAQALEVARIRHRDRARERLVQRLRSDQLIVDPDKVQLILDDYDLDWRVVPEGE